MKLNTKDAFLVEYNRYGRKFNFADLSHVSEAHDWGNRVGDIGSNFIVFPYNKKYIIIWAEKVREAFKSGAVSKTGGDSSHWYEVKDGEYIVDDSIIWFHPEFNVENNYVPTRGTWIGDERLEKFFDENGYNKKLDNMILKRIFRYV